MAAISVARVFDPGPILPVVEADQGIGVWVANAWLFFYVSHVESVPSSRMTQQDFGAITTGSSVTSTRVTVTDVPDGTLGHFRCAPVDPVEVKFASGSGTGTRHVLHSATARVTRSTANSDPHLSATTTFVWGNLQSIYAEVYNNSGYNLAQSRVRWWGYMYRTRPCSDDPELEKLVQKFWNIKVSRGSPNPNERGLYADVMKRFEKFTLVSAVVKV